MAASIPQPLFIARVQRIVSGDQQIDRAAKRLQAGFGIALPIRPEPCRIRRACSPVRHRKTGNALPKQSNRKAARFEIIPAMPGMRAAEEQNIMARIAQGLRQGDRKSTRLTSSHSCASRMPSSAWKKKNYRTITAQN